MDLTAQSRLPTIPTSPSFLEGGGQMGGLIRAHDWTTSPLGCPDGWPESLRSTLGLCLNSAFPIAIYWGPELALLYNDAWRPILGDKHPSALGRPGIEVWPEIWDAIEPVFRRVFETGSGVFRGDSLLAMNRFGYVEECYFDYTFNPIRSGSAVAGIFNVVIETTYRVVSARRAQALRDFAAALAGPGSVEGVARTASEALAGNAKDVAFALLYRVSEDGRRAQLAHAVGLDAGSQPREIDLLGEAPWPLAAALATGQPQCVAQLAGRGLPGGAWPERAREAVVLPVLVAGREVAPLVLIAGASPRRALEDDYLAFFESLAAHMGRAVASAEALESERRRAQALAELDRAKTAFFSNVSHEFRTPLTLMLGPVRDVLAKPADEAAADTRATLEIVHRNGQRLLRLVNTLLDFARIEAGRAQAAYEPTDLAALTAELASNFRSACERAGLLLAVDCPPCGEAWVDREMWEKIVLNLLSNAFKFTLQGGITVRLARDDSAFRLVVRDTGTGIPEAALAHVFERFHRVEGARGRSHEGSGIGLALVQELVKLQGGSIHVESRLGEGSAFTVRIPVGSAHLPVERIRAACAPGPDVARAEAFVGEALSWLPGADQAPATARPGAPRVLLVDDNADLRDYARKLLAESFDVEAVADGEAALAAARRRTPDLLVTDIMMPKLDGFGLIRELRADPALRDVPVVALSARAGDEARLEGLARGADEYLTKPFSANELLVRCAALLRSRRALHESQARAAQLSALYELTARLQRASSEAQIHEAALDAIVRATGCKRASILLFDEHEVMRFVAWRGLSDEYRHAVEGHSPWRADERNARPFGVEDVEAADLPGELKEAILRERIRALAFVPLAGSGRLLGKFMLYRDSVHAFGADELDIAVTIGTHVALGVERYLAEKRLRESEQQLRIALEAGSMGTWQWDIAARRVSWSASLEALHGLQAGTFGGTLEDFGRDIVPEDRHRVEAAIARALGTGEDHHIEYRIALPDGAIRWVEGRGKLLRDGAGRPHRMVGVCADITARKETESALRESDRRKDEFIATLSHELRNPLAPLRNALFLWQGQPEAAADERIREMMTRQVEHLVRLVDDLLEMSRVSRGQLELRRERIPINGVVHSAIETSTPLVEEGRHHLALSLPEDELWVDGDQVRLAQVVSNLLNNSARYTPPGGRIEVRVTADRDDVVVAVCDNGEGIDPDVLPRMFDMFTRGERVKTRTQGGLGIGLALARRLATMHGGNLEGRSEGPGRGTEMILRLPRAAPPAAAEPDSGETTRVVPGMRVLVVDDNVDAAESLAMILRAMGCDVRTAHDGPSALKVCAASRPTLILLDIGMPGMDGFDVIRRLRAAFPSTGLRIVAVTGWGQEEDRRRTHAAGFDGHLVKPVDPAKLQGLLASMRDEERATPVVP
jgi:PAS domain S-box-containing protein